MDVDVKQTADVDAAAETTAEAAPSPDSATIPAVVFSGLSFFPACAETMADGETTGTAAAETMAEAVTPAGFSLFSFFCAATTAAAADCSS